MNSGKVGALIATENAFSKTWKGRIEIYSSDGTQINIIPLDHSTVVNPWCLAFAGNDSFVVTHGLSTYGVIKVESGSEHVTTYKHKVHTPRSIKCDHGNCEIYVADAGNCSILCFGMKLELKSVVQQWFPEPQSNREDWQPMRIALSSKKDEMYVGMESGKINLYEYKRSNNE
jgi:hypothetical protein